MSNGKSFELNRAQIALAAVIVSILAALTFSMVSASNRALKLTIDSNSAGNPQIESYVQSQHATAHAIIILLLISRILIILLIVWVVISLRARNRKQRLATLKSQATLNEVRKELGVAHEQMLTLRSINEAKTEFVSTVNHELRTPLTSIIGYIDLLQEFTLVDKDKEFHRYLDVMDRNASILLELVESILFLTALDSREALADTAIIDLVELCEECVASQLLAINTANINVSGNYNLEHTYSVLGNKTLLMQVFTNLISNALKFSSENSKVEISFSRYINEDQQKIVRVEVQDRGIGIPAQDLSLLFSRFFRASNAIGSEIPGSGIGLAIVKRIVELHQGKIFAESILGQGTSMIVELPFTISALEELVMGQRQDVLERAIKSIVNSQVAELVDITHDVGGAIGFYTFLSESEGLINFSRWLKANPSADQDAIIAKRDALLIILNQTLERIKKGDDF